MVKKITPSEIRDLSKLLIEWEDDNISDYEYCNKVGDILGYGNWTCKGYKGGEEENDLD